LEKEPQKNEKIKSILEEIAKSFEDNGSKLQFFKCLELPSDEIKLEIVLGLKSLSSDKFKAQEIS
jgi:hypothetical protein